MPYTGQNLMPLTPDSYWMQSINNNSNYASIDNVVTHNGNPSIKILGGQQPYPWGEIDGPETSVKGGDHVYMSCWIKSEKPYAPIGGLAPGSFFGWDFKGNTNVGYGILGLSNVMQAGHPQEDEWVTRKTIDGSGGLTQRSNLTHNIPFDTDWTFCQFDYYVPSTLYYWVWTTVSIYDVYPCNGAPIQMIAPWLGVRNFNDWAEAGHVWFAEPNLLINPEGSFDALSLPYHDSFADLANWQALKGAWNTS